MKFRTVVADPPWPFSWQGGKGGRRASATQLGYDTMEVYEIALTLPALTTAVHRDATLLLWTTQEVLHAGDARAVAEAWQFPHRIGEFIWNKPNFGTGDFPRIGHETCVIYKRGKGSLRPGRPRNIHSVQTWSQPRASNNGGKIHSAKPDPFYDLVEQGFEGPYLEMFARRGRLGDWHYWGDQSLGTAEVAA